MAQEIPFGELVKSERQHIGLTQAELARRVGCATITLRKIEANSYRPSVQILERLAMALDVPLAERAVFVRQAKRSIVSTPEPAPTPTPPPSSEEIGGEDLTGRSIHGFQLAERIGEGGYGAVYRAVQPGVEREVAVKIILPRYANKPDFIRRFEAEAQLVARLEHPFIVPLYDYWREPNAAYLIMRLMRAGSLKDLIKDGPLPLKQVLRLVEQVSHALHFAHRFGVIHRDLKPANILLDDDQNAYLADFGIAKNLGDPEMEGHTTTGAFKGSFAYISPEQIRSEPVLPQADIYSLGILVYQLLAGDLPYAGSTPIDHITSHLNTPLPSILNRNPSLPVGIESVLQRATAKKVTERHPDVLAMLADIQEAVNKPGMAHSFDHVGITPVDVDAIENPFKGLRAFSEADEEDFFGRETLVQDLLGSMGEEHDLSRFLAVVGPSGSGKSSVVKAGLIPALRRGGLQESDKWFIVDFLPGAHPFEELEAALLRVAVNPPESLLGQLKENERGLVRAVRRVLPADDSVELVLVIDQFEELFTLVQNEEACSQFLEALVEAVMDTRSRLRVVITLRADFVDRPLEYVDFGELMQERMKLVLPLTPDELEEAINGPAHRVGLLLEEGLTARIVHDLGYQPGSLPLLQHTLSQLYDGRDGRRLTLEAYDEIGGVLGSLGRKADDVFQRLDQPGRDAAHQLFLRLVTLGVGTEDTRRRVLQSEIMGLLTNGRGMVLETVIQRFGAARLLTFDRDPITRSPTLEVAHEALLREWRRLVKWLEESRVDLRYQRQLAQSAEEWEKTGRDPSFLIPSGAKLDQFTAWRETTGLVLTQIEEAYLQASIAADVEQQERAAQQARSRRNLRRALVGALAVGFIVAIGLSIFAFGQQRLARAETQRRATQQAIAEEQAALAGTSAANALAQKALAEEEAAARATQQAIAEEQSIIAQEQEHAALLQAAIGLASQAELQMTSIEPERAVLLALEAIENYPYTWQAERALGEAVLSHKLLLDFHHGNVVGSADISPDGSRIVTTGDGKAIVWDALTGETIVTLDLQDGGTGFSQAQWSPSGDRILTNGASLITEIWDASTGDLLHSFTDHEGFYAEWSPDGSRIHTSYSFSKDSVVIWDANTGEEVVSLPGQVGLVKFAAWSPDGNRIFTTTGDVWDTETGEKLFTVSGYENQVDNQLQILAWYSPDGSLLAGGFQGGGAGRVWDAATGEELFMLNGHAGGITVDWSPNGDRLITVSINEGIAIIWDVESGEAIHALPGITGWVGQWSPDGTRLLVAGESDQIKVWDAVTGTALITIQANMKAAGTLISGWFPSGERIMTVARDGHVKVWNVRESLSPFGCQPDCPFSYYGGWSSDAGWSPDGEKIGRGFIDGTIKVWDVSTGEELHRMHFEPVEEGHVNSGVQAITWSPDGDRLLTTGNDGAARIWVVATGEELLLLPGEETEYSGELDSYAAWAPDGTRILTASTRDGFARVWDAKTGEVLLTFSEHIPFSAAWSPDGTRIVTTDRHSKVGSAKIWDAATGEVLTDLFPPDFGFGVSAVAWSPDGTRLVTFSMDSLGRIWDADTGEELLIFPGLASVVGPHMEWSPSGDRILTGGGGGEVKVWDAHTGVELFNFRAPGGLVSASWSPDRNFIAISDWAGNVWIYPAWQSPQELVDYARDCCVIRDLTPEERELFGLALKTVED